jgi:hypothetical protein
VRHGGTNFENSTLPREVFIGLPKNIYFYFFCDRLKKTNPNSM